jgi:hypothetical protein
MIGGGTHAELYRNKCGTYTETIGLRGGQKRNLRNLRHLITRECRGFFGEFGSSDSKKTCLPELRRLPRFRMFRANCL